MSNKVFRRVYPMHYYNLHVHMHAHIFTIPWSFHSALYMADADDQNSPGCGSTHIHWANTNPHIATGTNSPHAFSASTRGTPQDILGSLVYDSDSDQMA